MAEKVGRNDPCPCGSGKKYKDCCMRKDQLKASGNSRGQATASRFDSHTKPLRIDHTRWYPPARKELLDFAAFLEDQWYTLEGRDSQFDPGGKRPVDHVYRVSDAIGEAEEIWRERQSAAPRPERIESIEDLEQLIKSLPTWVREELDWYVSYWQSTIWSDVLPEERAAIRAKMSDEDMRSFLRAIAEQHIYSKRVKEWEDAGTPYTSSSPERFEEWSEALASAAPEGHQETALEDFRTSSLQSNIWDMSLKEMHALVRRSRETMSEEEIEQHLQEYREDMSEEELREFLLDFVVEFERLAAADRERRGSLKRLEDLTVEEMVSMGADGLARLVRANIALDPPLARRRRFLWELVVQEGKSVSAEVESVASEIRGLSPEQKGERFLDLFRERIIHYRLLTEEDMLELTNDPTYHLLLEELKVIPDDTLAEMLFEKYWRAFETVRKMLSQEPKEARGTVLGRRV